VVAIDPKQHLASLVGLIDEEAYNVGNPEFALSRILQGPPGRNAQGRNWGMIMTALVQAAIRRTEEVSGFGLVVLFSLFGLVFSLAIVRFGFDIAAFG
jgi:hypothetical protein